MNLRVLEMKFETSKIENPISKQRALIDVEGQRQGEDAFMREGGIEIEMMEKDGMICALCEIETTEERGDTVGKMLVGGVRDRQGMYDRELDFS